MAIKSSPLYDTRHRMLWQAFRETERPFLLLSEMAGIFGVRGKAGKNIYNTLRRYGYDVPPAFGDYAEKWYGYAQELWKVSRMRDVTTADMREICGTFDVKNVTEQFARYGIDVPPILRQKPGCPPITYEYKRDPADDIRRGMRAVDLYPSGLPVFDSPTEREGKLWYMVR